MSERRKKVSIHILRDRLLYLPDEGVIFWKRALPRHFSDGVYSKERRCECWNGRFSGNLAFTTKIKGYPYGVICGVGLYAHRVAWAMTYGCWPQEIDHINGDRSDYRIKNLRLCSRSLNCANKPISAKNHSPQFRGVSFRRSTGRFLAQIKADQKTYHLGSFESEVDAARAYDDAARKYFGEFANLNFPSGAET